MIMAGGRGERFWPRSTAKKPKQFAPIISEKSMLEETVARFENVTDKKNVYVSTGENYSALVQSLLGLSDEESLVLEPMGRDTAAAIALCAYAVEAAEDDVLFLVPADHYIDKLENYQNDVRQGAALALEQESMVLIGIPPTEASTAYGYIELSAKEGAYYQVKQFKEKPDSARAEQYLKSGQYFWNSGMFFFPLKTIRKMFEEYAPDIAASVKKYLQLKASGEKEKADKLFSEIRKISFDYAVVEKAEKVLCIPSSFVWDDVGSWNALARVRGSDEEGNCLDQNVRAYGVKNTTCVKNANECKVVLNGVEDLNIVLEGDTLYICKKDSEGAIKEILKDLKTKGEA